MEIENEKTYSFIREFSAFDLRKPITFVSWEISNHEAGKLLEVEIPLEKLQGNKK